VKEPKSGPEGPVMYLLDWRGKRAASHRDS
jgi:hypothetical protein